ncbi:MAG: ATPase [Actinomycetota bacterium]|nr:ATPase [Actinomycetota bacterium]
MAANRTLPDVPTAALHIVTGKGGTGKTTVAAALAVALATGGRRTLLIEVEGRQGLAQLFDVAPLPYEEKRLASAPRRGEVYGLAVDPEQAFLEYLDMFFNLRRAGRALRAMGAIDFVTTIAPGMRDVLMTGKVKEAAVRTERSGENVYDAVILDAPPTGRIRQFLDVTRDVAGLTKMGPIHKQSQGVTDVLHRPSTRVHLVTLLEEMPVQETLDAAADLRAGGFHLGHAVVNRNRPELFAAGLVRRTETGRLGERKALGTGLAEAGLGAELTNPLAQQLADYALRQHVQEENAARLEALNRPTVRLPELAAPIDLGDLYELAAVLGEAIVA